MTERMTTGLAVSIIEDGDYDDERHDAAWQHLIDTGVVWVLQGWYGREAARRIEEGLSAPAGA